MSKRLYTRIASRKPLTDPATLGGRLHIARANRRVDIFELAEATGLGVVTIRGLESGAVITTAPNLRRLAAALEIDPEWLQKGKVAA